MIFLYHEDAGLEQIRLRGDVHKYLVKVRRHNSGDTIALRNEKEPSTLYTYTITHITQRELHLELISQTKKEVLPPKRVHIGWCIIDPKSIEKTLPSLNEIGVSKISFIYCKRSQKNFKPDLQRLFRILKSSNQQCGRSDFMEFALYKNLEDFLADFPNVKVFDFGGKPLGNEANFEDVLIGCEGGFSQEEKQRLQSKEVFSLSTPFVLRSETAALAVASKLML